MKLLTKCIIISVIPYVILFSLRAIRKPQIIIPNTENSEITPKVEETQPIAAYLPSTLPISTPVKDSEKIFVVIRSDKIEIAALVLIDDQNQQIEVTNILSPNLYFNCVSTKNCTYTDTTTNQKENIKYYVIIDHSYVIETVKTYEPIKLNYCIVNNCFSTKEYYTQEEVVSLLDTIGSADLYPSIISGVKNKILENIFSIKTLSLLNNVNKNIEHNLPMSLFNKCIDLVLKKKDYKIIVN